MDIYVERLTAARQKLPDWNVDAVLITGTANRRWLSGFTGTNGQLLITPDRAWLATDFRYYERARQEAPLFELFKHRRTRQDGRRFFQQAGVKRIGLEANNVTLAQAKALRGLRTGVKWVPLEETVEPLRAVKTAGEIEKLRAAAAITDEVMAQVNQLAHPGMTEKELAWALEKRMREAGADGVAFPVTVASGPNSALPHHQTGSRRLQAGDVIVVDMGAELDGYKSDMTRSFYLGQPDAEFWEIYNLVLAAHTAVFEQLRPGMTLCQIDSIARSLIKAAGHDEHFGHGLGHGVGLDIHEAPFLSPRVPEEARLEVGMTVTIEPGVYVPGWGGIRIEDLAWVTPNGLERISHCPKTAVIPG